MGAKTWMLVYAKGNVSAGLRSGARLDRNATGILAKRLFPRDKLVQVNDGNLSYTCPPADELHIGCFDGVSVVAATEFGIDYPSKLPARFISANGGNLYLHVMHSVVDWFAFAQWVEGKLIRSLSLSPESGILEDVGERLPFEAPFWLGLHPAVASDEDDYPFPFHPLELGEAALRELFGFQLEGPSDNSLFDPRSIPLVKYRRSPSRWKWW